MKILMVFLSLLLVNISHAYDNIRRPPPDGAEVRIVNLKDGDIVKPQFKVVIESKNIPIGPVSKGKEFFHHHIIIDRKDLKEMKDNKYNPPSIMIGDIHLGKGDHETVLSLPPGKHSLQLLVGDYDHIPTYPTIVSDRVEVIVQE